MMGGNYQFLGKNNAIVDKDSAEIYIAELEQFCSQFLMIPRREYLKLQAMIDDYECRKAAMYGQGVSYDSGGLGVRVQTTPANTFESTICNIHDMEEAIYVQHMKYFTSWMTVKNLINQMELKDRKGRNYVIDRIRKTMIAYYYPTRHYPSFERLSKEMGLNYQIVRRNYINGEAALRNAIEKHCFHEI